MLASRERGGATLLVAREVLSVRGVAGAASPTAAGFPVRSLVSDIRRPGGGYHGVASPIFAETEELGAQNCEKKLQIVAAEFGAGV